MLPYQAIETPWRPYMPVFLTTGVGLSLTLAAGIMFWVRLFDTVVELLLGVPSDHKASRFGRRRTWMALTALGFFGFVPGAADMVAGEAPLRTIYALPSCLAGLIGLLALRRIAPAQCRSVS